MPNIKTKNIEGVYIPVVTPFRADQSVNLQGLSENIKLFNHTDVSGYMPLGSNGEFASLNDLEACEVVECVADSRTLNKQLFAGIGKESAREAIRMTKNMAGAGADAVFVLPPHYFPGVMTMSALESFYLEIADASPIPVIVYNAPGYAAGVAVEPALIKRLSMHENIIAMKNTSQIEEKEYISAAGENCAVLAGTFSNFWNALEQGAAGGVLSGANYLPEMYAYIYRLYKKNDKRRAKKLYDYLRDFASKTAGKYGVAGVKAVANMFSINGGVPRRPLTPVPVKQQEEMRALIEEVKNHENCNWL